MSDLSHWIETLFSEPDLLRMGHNQRAEDANLGLGWLYYALARIVRPQHAVVIGSLRGFVPAVLGKALGDNCESGAVTFIDPSLVDDFWKDEGRVARHFAELGAPNVRHVCMTTQEFAASDAYGALSPVGLLFVDGYHTAEQARFDFETFLPLLELRGMALFHDSMVSRDTNIYGDADSYRTSVPAYLATLKEDAAFQVLDVPFGTGVTLVRRLTPESERPLELGKEYRLLDD